MGPENSDHAVSDEELKSLDQDTRQQITWIAIIALVVSLVVIVAHRRSQMENLLEQIAERSPQARMRAAQTLIEQQKLAEALENRSRWVQDRAVEAAAAVGTESALQQLVAVKPIVDAPVSERIDAFLTSLNTRAVGPLVLALQDKDGAVRSAASGPLKTIGEPAVVSLIPLVDVYDNAVRSLVSSTLGGIGEPSVKPLLQVMKQQKPGPDQGPAAFRRAKSAAQAAFKAMGETALDPVIDELLTHEDPQVRIAATDILGAVAAGLDEEIALEAVPPLLARLSDDDAWAVRRKAASALGGLGETAVTGGAVEPLIARLDDTRAEVRASAATALGNLDDPAAAGPLADLLRTRRIGATAEIADALEKLGRPAIGPLTPALTHPDVAVRLTATQTIAAIGTEDAVAPLGTALDDTEVKVRRAAADALRNLADTRVLDQLAKALGDDESAVYYAARDALARLGPPAIPVLLARLDSESTRVAYIAEQALAKIGEPAVGPLLTAIRGGQTQQARNWAAVALGQVGEAAVEPASELLKASGAAVDSRVAAARALGTTGSFNATDALTEATASGPAAVRIAAIKALGEIGDERATDALVAALEDATDNVRETAMNELITWRLGEVDEKLTKLLDSADDDAARRAAIILSEHTPAASGELIRAIGAVQEDVPGQEPAVRTHLEETVADPDARGNLREMAILALRWVGTEQSLDALAPQIRVGSEYAEIAAKAIGHIGQRLAREEERELEAGEEARPTQATDLLLDVFDTAQSDDLRIVAAAGLAVMGGQPVQPLIDRVKKVTDPDQRAWLIAILGAIGKSSADPVLDARGRAEDRELANWYAAALELIGDARALDLLKQLPKDQQPDPEKVRAGRVLLQRINKTL